LQDCVGKNPAIAYFSTSSGVPCGNSTSALNPAPLLRVAAEPLYYILLVIFCSDYLHTLYDAHSYYPIPTLLDCSVGGVSPPPGAIRNQLEGSILCSYTRYTSISTSSILLLVSS